MAKQGRNSGSSKLSEAEATRLAGSGYWTVGEVCSYLEIGRTTLYEMRKRGEIPFMRRGRSIRFPIAAVIEYGKAHMQAVN